MSEVKYIDLRGVHFPTGYHYKEQEYYFYVNHQIFIHMKLTSTTLLLCSLLCISGFAQENVALDWNHTIKTESSKDEIDGQKLHCYSTIVYEANKGELKDLISDEVKIRTGEKASQKKLKGGVNMSFPKYTTDQVEVRSKLEDIKKSDDMKVVIAFFLDSVNVSPDMPQADKAANEIVTKFGVILNQSVVAAQIAGTEKSLEDLEKEREKLVKEKEKLNKTVTDGNQKVKKLDADKTKLESKLVKAQDEAILLEATSQASTATSKDIKKYADAKDKVVKIEADILKNQEDVLKENEKIAAANKEIPENAEEIEENAASIASTKEVLTKLNSKYDAIQ